MRKQVAMELLIVSLHLLVPFYFLVLAVFFVPRFVIDSRIKAPLLTMIGGAAILVALLAAVRTIPANDNPGVNTDSLGTLAYVIGTIFGTAIIIVGSWHWLTSAAAGTRVPVFKWFLSVFSPFVVLWLPTIYEEIAELVTSLR